MKFLPSSRSLRKWEQVLKFRLSLSSETNSRQSLASSIRLKKLFPTAADLQFRTNKWFRRNRLRRHRPINNFRRSKLSRVLLSLIIPAYNEADRIGPSVGKAYRFF